MSFEDSGNMESLEMIYLPKGNNEAWQIAQILQETLVEFHTIRQFLPASSLDSDEGPLLEQVTISAWDSDVPDLQQCGLRVIQQLLLGGDIMLTGPAVDDVPSGHVNAGEIWVSVLHDGPEFEILVPMKCVKQMEVFEAKSTTIFLRALKEIVHQLGVIGAERRKNIARMLHPLVEKLLYYMNA